jgi:hypothetical protein
MRQAHLILKKDMNNSNSIIRVSVGTKKINLKSVSYGLFYHFIGETTIGGLNIGITGI